MMNTQEKRSGYIRHSIKKGVGNGQLMISSKFVSGLVVALLTAMTIFGSQKVMNLPETTAVNSARIQVLLDALEKHIADHALAEKRLLDLERMSVPATRDRYTRADAEADRKKFEEMLRQVVREEVKKAMPP